MSNDSFKSKIYNTYIKRLLIDYKKRNVDLFNILKKIGKDDIKIVDCYENFEGRNFYTLVFLLPEECFENDISISDQANISQKIKEDLNQIILESDEYIKEITFDLKPERLNEKFHGYIEEIKSDLKNLDKKLHSKEAENFVTKSSERNGEIDIKDYLKTKIKNFEIPDFWNKDCLRVFISYADTNYEIAKKLKIELLDANISCFVARENTQGKRYTKEIKKALNTMELMITLVSKDFNKSCWTNQEVGFACCRDIDIIPIKLDKENPKGFISGISKVELNINNFSPNSEDYLKIINEIKSKVPNHPFTKNNLLKKFFSAKDSCFDLVKERVMEIIHLDFNDIEIERIVKEITDKNSQSGNWGGINQLSILLLDRIAPDRLSQLPENEKDKYEYYAELLNDKILSQHTQNRYSITQSNGRTHCEIIDNQAIPPKTHKETKKQDFEDIPF